MFLHSYPSLLPFFFFLFVFVFVFTLLSFPYFACIFLSSPTFSLTLSLFHSFQCSIILSFFFSLLQILSLFLLFLPSPCLLWASLSLFNFSFLTHFYCKTLHSALCFFILYFMFKPCVLFFFTYPIKLYFNLLYTTNFKLSLRLSFFFLFNFSSSYSWLPPRAPVISS